MLSRIQYIRDLIGQQGIARPDIHILHDFCIVSVPSGKDLARIFRHLRRRHCIGAFFYLLFLDQHAGSAIERYRKHLGIYRNLTVRRNFSSLIVFYARCDRRRPGTHRFDHSLLYCGYLFVIGAPLNLRLFRRRRKRRDADLLLLSLREGDRCLLKRKPV